MTKKHDQDPVSDQNKQNPTTPELQPGSDAWWEARLIAIAGGRVSALESNDWVGDFGGTTSTSTDATDTDDVTGDLTDDLASG
ncbi:hypothetical protein ACNOYE_06025 [Nannocystaceae bacterium ST9]